MGTQIRCGCRVGSAAVHRHAPTLQTGTIPMYLPTYAKREEDAVTRRKPPKAVVCELYASAEIYYSRGAREWFLLRLLRCTPSFNRQLHENSDVGRQQPVLRRFSIRNFQTERTTNTHTQRCQQRTPASSRKHTRSLTCRRKSTARWSAADEALPPPPDLAAAVDILIPVSFFKRGRKNPQVGRQLSRLEELRRAANRKSELLLVVHPRLSSLCV